MKVRSAGERIKNESICIVTEEGSIQERRRKEKERKETRSNEYINISDKDHTCIYFQ